MGHLPRESHLLGIGGLHRRWIDFPDRFASVEPITLLKDADHPLDLVPIGVGWELPGIEALVAWPHRREFALDEFHEVRAGAVLQVHDVAAKEPGAVVCDGLDRPFELRP